MMIYVILVIPAGGPPAVTGNRPHWRCRWWRWRSVRWGRLLGGLMAVAALCQPRLMCQADTEQPGHG